MKLTKYLAAFCAASIFLLAAGPARAWDKDLKPLQFKMPMQVHADVSASGCENSPGPTITISGELSLGGFTADLIFKNNVKGTHTAVEVGRQTAILLQWGTAIELPKQPVLGGVGGNPHIWLEFLDEQNNAISAQLYLGRCVQGFQVDPAFLIDVLTNTHIHGEGCSNRGGPFITLDQHAHAPLRHKSKAHLLEQISG